MSCSFLKDEHKESLVGKFKSFQQNYKNIFFDIQSCKIKQKSELNLALVKPFQKDSNPLFRQQDGQKKHGSFFSFSNLKFSIS